MLFTPRQSHSSQNHGNAKNAFFQPRVQTKLEVDSPNSAAEKEADHVADQVVQRSLLSDAPTEPFFPPSNAVQRKPETNEQDTVIQEVKEAETEQEIQPKTEQKPLEIQQKPDVKAEHTTHLQHLPIVSKKEDEGKDNEKEEEEEEEPVQLKTAGERTVSGGDFSGKLNASKGGGNKLDEPVKQEMQQGFGADFSNVRIHTDSNASTMSKGLGAQAFTNGNDIYFNDGKYDTNSAEGKHLLAHELTHTIQQGASGPDIQRKPEDYEHPEDGNQSMDGINEEVVDELGEDKNIRNPQISAEERAESKPPRDEKGEGVDQQELQNSAKPDVDRKEETQPQINETLQKTGEELNNVQAPQEPEEKEITKKEKKLSPKEQALMNAKKSYIKANRVPEKVEVTPVEIPEIKVPKDAAGNELQGNPEAETKLLGIVGKIQLLREQAATLKEGADQEKINAEIMRGDIQVMYHGVYTSDEFIDKAGKHTESRKEGVEGMKEQLQESKTRTEQVTTALPDIQEKAAEGKEESGPMAESSQERKQSNDNLNADDEDARAEAEERGGELNSADSDAQNIDHAITETRDKAQLMAEQSVVSTQNNTETETTIGQMDTQIAAVEEKLAADTAINTAAKTQLGALSTEPDTHLRQAKIMDARADEKLQQSDELEEQLHETYDEYHERMESVQPDPSTTLQAQMEDGNSVPNIQLTPEDGVQSPAQQQQNQHNNWFAEQVNSMDSVTDEQVRQMYFYEKAWFGLKRTYYDIRSSLSQVNWGKFTEDLLRGLVDPVFLIHSMGELFNAVIHPKHRPGEDPLTYLLREAAGWATAIAITFGTIAGLCLIGMGVLAVVNFWFPPSLIWSPPIYAELGALMSWSGSMLWATTQIALVLHALVFISDLLATAFSETASQLVNNSRQMRSDVDAAAFPIITALTVGFFEFMGGAARRLGINRPNNPGEGANPSTREGAGTTETPNANAEVRTTETPTNTEPVNRPPGTQNGENVPANERVNGPEGENTNNRTNGPEENRTPNNNESARTVDGLEVKNEFRGEDGHTRKVLEDGQVARCTICERCRVRYQRILQESVVLREYLDKLEASFRSNPNDPVVSDKQMNFETDLEAIQRGDKTLESVEEVYKGNPENNPKLANIYEDWIYAELERLYPDMPAADMLDIPTLSSTIDKEIGAGNRFIQTVYYLVKSPGFKNVRDLAPELRRLINKVRRSDGTFDTQAGFNQLNEYQEGLYWLEKGDQVEISVVKNGDEIDGLLHIEGAIVECKRVASVSESGIRDNINNIIKKFTLTSKLKQVNRIIFGERTQFFGQLNVSNPANPFYNLNKAQFIERIKSDYINVPGGIQGDITVINQLNVVNGQGRFTILSSEW